MNNGKGIFSSPKTTWAAILAFLAIVATQVGYNFDADPATNLDWAVIAAQIPILIGLLFARDGDKSSEDVGLIKEEKATPSPPSNARPFRGVGR